MAHDILIVDDEPDIRTLIEGILSDEGYETRQAHNSDAALAAFRARVTAVEDATLPRGAARVTARALDGRVLTLTVEHPRGSAQRPLSDAELDAKFHANAALGGFSRAAPALAALWALEAAPPGLAPLMALLA
jgi:2-methylcitrate dehydratase PrpD